MKGNINEEKTCPPLPFLNTTHCTFSQLRKSFVIKPPGIILFHGENDTIAVADFEEMKIAVNSDNSLKSLDPDWWRCRESNPGQEAYETSALAN